MNKIILISLVIFFALWSKSWAKDITPKYEPNELYAESDCQQIRAKTTGDMDSNISTDNMTASSLACISFFGQN
jgi:hypothetical protein